MGDRMYNSIIYLLFLVIVIGVFASIAQNDYGANLIAIACFSFGLLFLLRMFDLNSTESLPFPKNWSMQEYTCLALVVVLFGLRALRIRFDYVEEIFVGLTLIMTLIYLRYYLFLRKAYIENESLFRGLTLLYLSIGLFFISLSLNFYLPQVSTLIGIVSFILMLVYFVCYVWKNPNTVFKQETTSIYSELFKYKNLAPVITTLIFLASFYMGLFKIGAIPAIYTGELPIRYIELEKEFLDGEGLKSEVIPKHEQYWNEYEEFLKYMNDRPKE